MRRFRVCLVVFLSLFSLGMIFPLQGTAAVEAEFDTRKAEAATDLSSLDFPESFVLGSHSGVSTAALSSASSYPSSVTWMEGKVPYFDSEHTGWCAIYCLKQVFWWWGMTDIYELDIAEYFDITDPQEGIDLEQIHSGLRHFLGQPMWIEYIGGFPIIRYSCRSTWGSGNMEVVKSWINAGAPVICGIRSPGSGPGDEADHTVTLFGWDDSLDGGSWLIHDPDPNTLFSPPNWDPHDVWVEYDVFDNYWNKGSTKRAMASAIPGDTKYPVTTVRVFEVGSTVNPSTFTYEVHLINHARTDIGEGDHGLSGTRAHGVFIRLRDAEFVDVDVGGFDEYQAYDADENEISLSGAKIVELYTGIPLSLSKGFNIVVGHVTIRPTSGRVRVQYRGWIRDEDERAVGPPVEIDDDRYGDVLTTTLMEPRAVRDPYDVNFKPNFLDYITHSISFNIVENPVLTSPTHSIGQVSTDQVLTVEWETPWAHAGVGGYSYVIVSQDDPYWDVNRWPDDTMDLGASVTSFTTPPLEPGHIWEFNIRTIDSEGNLFPTYYSSFWVEICSATVRVYLLYGTGVYEVGEWFGVSWEQPTYGGLDVGGAYDLDTVDLFKGSSFVMTVVSDWPVGASEAGFPVPNVEGGMDYSVRVVLGRNAVGDQYPYLPEEYVGFSDFFAIASPPPPPPVVVDVAASDAHGYFSVTIDVGADKGAPITSLSIISTTNVELHMITYSEDGMVIVIEGQLLDPSLGGQLVLEVDPVDTIITYEINIAPYEAPTGVPEFGFSAAIMMSLAAMIYLLLRKRIGKNLE